MSVRPPISENGGTPGTRCTYPQATASRRGYRVAGNYPVPKG